MNSPRLLDLFCGAGGCARGYHDAGFDVVGVDIVPQPHYPYTFIQADALVFLDEKNLSGFSAIHASPVCKGYSPLSAMWEKQHPKLIPDVRRRLERTGLPWVIENVQGAVHELPSSLMLCGTMFGLEIERHRYFESSMLLFAPGRCQHRQGCISIHGNDVWDSTQKGTRRKDGRIRPKSIGIDAGRKAMNIDGMTGKELSQAIPPIYTCWIGTQFLAAIQADCEIAV